MMPGLILRDVRKLFKSGNSYAVSLPIRALRKTDFRFTKVVTIEIYDNKIIIRPARH